jgi:hypothetical protein
MTPPFRTIKLWNVDMPKTELFPDTLHLPDLAALAENCLINGLDHEDGDLPYCLFDIMSAPPRKAHTCFDWSDHTGRMIDALYLIRTMTGSKVSDRVLPSLIRLLDKGFGADGLHYTPENQWTAEQANMHYQRSVINALLSRHLTTGSEEALDRLRALLAGLAKISVKRKDYWYFPAVEYFRSGWFRGDWDILGYGTDPANTNGRLIYGISCAHELLNDEVSAELAGNYARHAMYYSSAFLEDGSFSTGMEFREGHFHSRAVTMLGVIRYGVTFGDSSAVSWGKKVFDRAAKYGTTFGWFPERIVEERAHGCETCATVDMMEAAIWLARAGYPEYWETAERFLRNQLVESQLKDVGSLVRARRRINPNDPTPQSELQGFVGGFSGWSQPNDLLSKVMHDWDFYMCCCCQGVRGLFNAYTNAVSSSNRGTEVNLLINHASPAALVRSYLPTQGRVEVTVRRAGRVAIRIPAWVERGKLKAWAGQVEAPARCVGHQLVFDSVQPGDAVSMTFPVALSSSTERVLGVDYTSSWLGDSIVKMDPAGSLIPLYDREAALHGPIHLVEKTACEVPFSL